ncbi:hypothetical protein ABMA32_22790 [Mesorhizobium sp. VNQ89]|uniref:hypothetical protein n=1 Tax=Mesorhizobium quangtriensis TaxID=3157709 RepID=UPI0032B8304B
MSTPPPPIMRFLEKVDAAHKVFRSVLGAAIPDQVFTERAVTISDDGQRLYEFTGNNRVLAEAVLGVDFPRAAGPIELDHYTTLTGLKAIVASRKIHLRAVATYLHEGEFATFAQEHGLQGYFDDNGRGKQVLEDLSDNLFFISLTKPGNPDETTLWDAFANEGRGVRLRLRVTPTPAGDLRTMSYQTGHPTALKQINDALASEGLVYTPWTISRICAFYLPLGYRVEREVRLLVKRHEDGVDRTIQRGPHTVWPVALAAPGATTGDPACEIELVEVTAGPRCMATAVQAAVAGSVYAEVAVS